jgi:hypothetical protein
VLVTGDSWQITTLEQGQVPQISQQQVDYDTVFDYGGLIVVTLIGVEITLAVLLLASWYARGSRLIAHQHAGRPARPDSRAASRGDASSPPVLSGPPGPAGPLGGGSSTAPSMRRAGLSAGRSGSQGAWVSRSSSRNRRGSSR